MKKHNLNRWGPKDGLGRLISEVPYGDTPDLEKRIMASLRPYQSSLFQRMCLWLRRPMTFSLSPAMAFIILFLCLLPIGYLATRFQGVGPSVSQVDARKKGIPVIFYYKGPEAQSVAVIGSFNNWNPKGYELSWQPDLGRWSLKLHLNPGKHEYVFLVNGEKVYPDPDADLIQEDEFGSQNSVLFVKGKNGIHT